MTPQLLIDGDAGFNAVNDRLHPSLLPQGTLSQLVNGTLEFGDIRNRWGVHRPPWGISIGADIVGGAAWNFPESSGYSYFSVSGFEIGKTYLLTLGEDEVLTTDGQVIGIFWSPGDIEIPEGTFVATQEEYWLWKLTLPVASAGNMATTIKPLGAVSGPVALERFNDPEGYEYLVYVCSERRTTDGGQGHAWKIQSGSAPEEIPLNGHDVWGDSRLVPVRGGMVLLRHGPARWYWRYNSSSPNIDLGTDIITMNSVDGLYTGDCVTVVFFDDTIGGVATGGTINPLSGTEYWVNIVSRENKTIYLCASREDALAGTPIDLVSIGTNARFYLQKFEAYAPASTDGSANGVHALPLVLQTAVTSATKVQSWVNGFVAARTAFTAQNTALATEWFCENHNFMPGLAVSFTTATGTTFLTDTFYYVNPLDADRFTLHASVENALAADSPLATEAGGPYSAELIPLNATAAPMPGGREGTEVAARLVVASALDNIAVSNPHDFVHFQPYIAGVTANLGESTRITAVVPVSEYSVIIAKSDSVFALSGLESVSSSVWRLQAITKEYGCIAPLTAIQVGSDVWMLSRSGVMSVRQTELSKAQGVAIPISQPMSKSMLQVDWRDQYIRRACAAWFNNRYLLAVPLRNQTGTVVNNRIYVYNFLNQSWDGYWEASGLDVVQFARHTVNGQQRLAFVSSDGAVRFFVEEELTDMAEPIEMEVLTRGFTCGQPGPKLWQELATEFDSWYPEMDVAVQTEGRNEATTLQDGLSLDRTRFFSFNAGTRAPDSTQKYAEDYSLICGDTDAVCSDTLFPGVFQAVAKQFALHHRDRAVQVNLNISRGSVRIKTIGVSGVPDRMLAFPQPN